MKQKMHITHSALKLSKGLIKHSSLSKIIIHSIMLKTITNESVPHVSVLTVFMDKEKNTFLHSHTHIIIYNKTT